MLVLSSLLIHPHLRSYSSIWARHYLATWLRIIAGPSVVEEMFLPDIRTTAITFWTVCTACGTLGQMSVSSFHNYIPTT